MTKNRRRKADARKDKAATGVPYTQARRQTTQLTLADVMDRHPLLGWSGIGYFRDQATVEQRRADFAESRERLRASEAKVSETVAWLRENITPIKTPTQGSYALKHVMERSPGGKYVSNGVFIAAALIAGYPFKYTDGLNMLFGMSAQDVKRLRLSAVRPGHSDASPIPGAARASVDAGLAGQIVPGASVRTVLAEQVMPAALRAALAEQVMPAALRAALAEQVMPAALRVAMAEQVMPSSVYNGLAERIMPSLLGPSLLGPTLLGPDLRGPELRGLTMPEWARVDLFEQMTPPWARSILTDAVSGNSSVDTDGL